MSFTQEADNVIRDPENEDISDYKGLFEDLQGNPFQILIRNSVMQCT